MKKAKQLTALGIAAMLLLSAAGCGNTSGPAGPPAGEEAGQTVSPGGENGAVAQGAPADSQVTIKITWWGGQGRHDYTQQLLGRYMELNPHVTFEAVPSGWDGYFDKLATQAAAGAMPDVVQMDYLYITTYAQNGSLADLQPYMDNGTIDITKIDENLLKAGSIDGKMAGMVLSSSLLAVGYNPDVLAESGVAEPDSDWTWSDFIALNQSVLDRSQKMGSSTGPVQDTNLFRYWVRQHGEELFSQDNRSLGYADDRVCIDFFTLWKGMMDDGLTPNPDEFAALQALGQEGGPVVTGDSATTFEWNNFASKLSGVNDRLKVVTPPLSDDSDHKGLWLKPGMFFSVAESSPVKEEAAKFINWFVNSEEANDIIMAERGVPVSSQIREYMISSGALNIQQQEMFLFVDQALPYCGETPAPDPIGMSEINEVFKNSANSVFYGQSTPEAAAADFRAAADAILARNN